MIERVDIPRDPGRSNLLTKEAPGEGPDGYSPLPGELVATEKVEEVLDTIDLPATESEERIDLTPEELETSSQEEDEEPIEESLSPEDPVRLYLRRGSASPPPIAGLHSRRRGSSRPVSRGSGWHGAD